MATSKEYKDFITEKLERLTTITCKPAFGEYLLYFDGILFGGIYDDRFLVKITDGNGKFGFEKEIPYEGAKPMYLVDELDDEERLSDVVFTTCKDLKRK